MATAMVVDGAAPSGVASEGVSVSSGGIPRKSRFETVSGESKIKFARFVHNRIAGKFCPIVDQQALTVCCDILEKDIANYIFGSGGKSDLSGANKGSLYASLSNLEGCLYSWTKGIEARASDLPHVVTKEYIRFLVESGARIEGLKSYLDQGSNPGLFNAKENANNLSAEEAKALEEKQKATANARLEFLADLAYFDTWVLNRLRSVPQEWERLVSRTLPQLNTDQSFFPFWGDSFSASSVSSAALKH